MEKHATTLQSVGRDIWLAEGPIVSFYGFPYPTRSVIVRLPDGTLWVWSPIRLTPNLRAAVNALGPVGHLISPNKLHHLALAEWQQGYSDAALWGPPSTVAKCEALAFTGTLGDKAPPAWAGVIDQWLVPASLLLEEVVFYHRGSRTAILADLSEAFSDDFLRRHWPRWQRWIARHWGITERQGRAPLEIRLTAVRRREARRKIQSLIDRKPQRVIMAHGVWQPEGGAAFLAKAFDWLGVRPAEQVRQGGSE